MAVNIFIADDHPMTRAGIVSWLSGQDKFCLVGEAADGTEAWEKIEGLNPDVVLMDIEMPKENGIAVTRKIKERKMKTAVLMLTSYKAQPYVLASLKAGASGFILKTAPLDELESAIKTVHGGEFYIDPKISHIVPAEREMLTQREKEILTLSAQGLSGKDLSQMLSISERTVEAHLGSAYNKLGARNKTEAVLIALKNGVILLDELTVDGENL